MITYLMEKRGVKNRYAKSFTEHAESHIIGLIIGCTSVSRRENCIYSSHVKYRPKNQVLNCHNNVMQHHRLFLTVKSKDIIRTVLTLAHEVFNMKCYRKGTDYIIWA